MMKKLKHRKYFHLIFNLSLSLYCFKKWFLILVFTFSSYVDDNLVVRFCGNFGV